MPSPALPSVAAAQEDYAKKYRYHYISLSNVQLPAGYRYFQAFSIDDKGRVYGRMNDTSLNAHIAVYSNNAFTVFQQGGWLNPGVVNARGTTGGYLEEQAQAALFRGNSKKIIPFLPGETFTQVVSLNDSETALVWSGDDYGINPIIYRLYDNKGKILFSYSNGSDCPPCWGVNNQAVVAGAIFDSGLNAFRAIRFAPSYRNPQLLNPLPTDNNTVSSAINNAGNVLGLSYSSSNDIYHQHIGVSDRRGQFKSYFEGFGGSVLFNDSNLIVQTRNFDHISYILPKPGVRLNLMNLVDNPADVSVYGLFTVTDINNRGDMVGYSYGGGSINAFLFQRVFPED